jgi:hypothetical protein
MNFQIITNNYPIYCGVNNLATAELGLKQFLPSD